MIKMVRVTREVDQQEHHNYYGHSVHVGAVFFTFHGETYGCIDTDGGIALSELPGIGPCFEFPTDALEDVVDDDKPVYKGY